MTTDNVNRGGSEQADFEFCPRLSRLLQSRRTVGRSGKEFVGLDSLSSVNNLIVMRHLMAELQPSRTLEVGFGPGGSGLLFAACHDLRGSVASRQHVALDPLQSSLWDDCGLLMLEQEGLDGFLDFRESQSAVELPRFLEEERSFTLIYVDGSHLFEDVFVDAYYGLRLLEQGGVLLFDDSSDPQVAKVIRFLRRNLSDGLPELDLLPYRKRDSLRYRLARRIGRNQMTAFKRVGEVERQWNARLQRF